MKWLGLGLYCYKKYVGPNYACARTANFVWIFSVQTYLYVCFDLFLQLYEVS